MVHYSGKLPSEQASTSYATGLFSMPNLRSLTLVLVDLHETFFEAMSDVADRSRVGFRRHHTNHVNRVTDEMNHTIVKIN